MNRLSCAIGLILSYDYRRIGWTIVSIMPVSYDPFAPSASGLNLSHDFMRNAQSGISPQSSLDGVTIREME